MERVLSHEERIRRAEEIAELRRNVRGNYKNESGYNKRQVNKENESSQTRKNFAIKKMIKQICICLIIYTIFFIIKNQNFIFSESFINQTKDILSYDVNFGELYNNSIMFLQQKYKLELEEQKNEVNKEEKDEEETKSDDNQTENKQNNNDKNKTEKEENLSVMEKDAKYVKEKYALIKPVSGTISSEFGEREDENPIVTQEHKGIDIAANKGTKIVAAMDGVVDIATTSSSYGKYIQIVNEDVKTIYAHCNKLYVKKGDKVKKGQEIAEVGDTGEVTRFTFTF